MPATPSATAAKRLAETVRRSAETPAPPLVLHGLALLGLSGRALAEIVQVTPPAVSIWSSGRQPLPADREQQLLALLRLALATAVSTLGEEASGALDEEDERRFRDFRRRVQHARQILSELESANEC